MNSEDNSSDVTRDLHADFKNKRCSLKTLKTPLAGLDRQRRKQILDDKVDNKTLVTRACELNRLDLVRYFITECDLDVNTSHKFQYFSEKMSMLCWACGEPNQDLIKLILQNGAGINLDSRKGPLHYVCSFRIDGQTEGLAISEIIKLLIDNGAIVDGKTCTGDTPLMFASKRYNAVEICKALISRGADVNAVDDSGNSALHHHCRRHFRLDNVGVLKLLLVSGANLDLPNESNQTPLDNLIEECCRNCAMSRRVTLSVDYMQILLDRIPLKNKYDMLEICGAMLTLNREDVEYTLRIWQQAHLHKLEFPHVECCRSPDSNILSDVPECERSEQLEHLKLTDRVAVLKLAIVKSDRHMEFHSNLTLLLCKALLNSHKKEHCYDDGLNIFTKLLDFITENERQTKLFATTIDLSTELLMYRLVGYWFSILKYLGVTEYEYSLKLVSVLLTFLERRGFNTPLEPDYGYWVIKFLEHFTKSDMEMPKEARNALQTCIQYNRRFARDSKKGNLFHLACLRYTDCNLLTLKILLQNGMTANAVDVDGNTALHTCLLRRGQTDCDPLNEDKLLNFLINNTHMDIPNNEGVTPLDLLVRHTTIHPLDYITLKCLAARVISHHNIHHAGILPKTLEAFVVMH